MSKLFQFLRLVVCALNTERFRQSLQVSSITTGFNPNCGYQ